MDKPNFYESVFGGLGGSSLGNSAPVAELEQQVTALTKETDRLRTALVEAEARASRLARLHASRGTS